MSATSQPTSQELPSGISRKQSLYATVIRSCGRCGAPGYWDYPPGVKVGCYAPDRVTTLGSDPVGLTCPNCGSPRPSSVEDQGEIWVKLYGWAPVVAVHRFIQTLRRLFS